MSQSRPEERRNASGKKNNSPSLQTRLVLFVLFIALVPLITIATRDTLQTQQALKDGAEFSLKTGAEQTANSLDNFIQNTLDTVNVEAQQADFVGYLSASGAARTGTVIRERTRALLANLSSKDPVNIISYALVETDGNVIFDSATDLQFNESQETYFPQVRISNRPIVTVVTYSKDKTPSITFASKVSGLNGEYLGILRVTYRSTVLQDVILKSVGTTTDVSVLLLDPLHIRMADSQNPELIQKSIVPLDLIDYSLAVDTKRFLEIPAEEQATNYPSLELALDNIATHPFFTADIRPEEEGEDTFAVAFLQTQPWIITYSRPTSIFLAEVQKQIRTNIILLLGTSIIISIITAFVARSLANPISALAKVANSISQGDLNARAKVNTTDEIGMLASSFNSMTDQLQSTLVGLEQRIDERTADLQRSTLELETIAIVAREISIIRDVDTLLKASVELIRERFKYYHVGIFLIDERSEFAILRAASSIAAGQMLEQNYKLAVGKEGLVGNVTRTGRANVALDVGSNAVHFQNPYLPDTRSEVVLPLRSRNITIGALDIQTNIQSAFSEQSVKVLQLLADQLAVAIENAQLVAQVEKALTELNNTYRLQTKSVWQSTINQYESSSYEYDGIRVRAVPHHLPNEMLKQLENGEPIIVKEGDEQKNGRTKSTLMVPLMVLDQVIGVIGLEQGDPDHIWTDEEISIVQAAANRAGITLDNARLLEESQRRAVKERTIFESTTRIGSALNIENILEITAEELERVLSGSEVIIQFQTDHDQQLEK